MVYSHVLLILGLVASGTAFDDFFSALDELNIDEQLAEIDKMIQTLDADNLVDGMESTLDDILNGECQYKCENGGEPVPRQNHKASFNGCGSFGLEFEIDELPEMTSCCNKHDVCYDTCNKNRDDCDNEFKTCLDKICNKLRKRMTEQELSVCSNAATLMYSSTMALGCSPYLESQKTACVCQTVGARRDTSSTQNRRTVKQNNPSTDDNRSTGSRANRSDKKKKNNGKKHDEL